MVLIALRFSFGGMSDHDLSASCQPQAHELERTEHREVIAMVWAPGQECDIEGAGLSNARVVVVEGEMIDEAFERTDTGFRRVRRGLKAGQAVELPAGTVHRLACVGPAVTLHEFRPPRPRAMAV